MAACTTAQYSKYFVLATAYALYRDLLRHARHRHVVRRRHPCHVVAQDAAAEAYVAAVAGEIVEGGEYYVAVHAEAAFDATYYYAAWHAAPVVVVYVVFGLYPCAAGYCD